MDEFSEDRRRMVAGQLRRRGITSEHVLDAFLQVPRHAFVPRAMQAQAYDDRPLPIGNGQTISQPYIVAHMVELCGIRPGDRVLEVGTGSGYAAAICAHIAEEVVTVERHEQLLSGAREVFDQLAISNIIAIAGDGTAGAEEYAPFDRIIVSAAGPEIPQSLCNQLAIGGTMVIPVGTRSAQALAVVRRESSDEWKTERQTGVRFVPLIGAFGWGE